MANHISAGAIVHSSTEKKDVLLLHRIHTNTFHLPKGTQQSGETLEETVHREVMEESGVEIEIQNFVSVLQSTFSRDHKIIQKQTHYYSAIYKEGIPQPQDAEHDSAAFVSLAQALDLLKQYGAHITLGYENEYELLNIYSKKV